MAMSDESGFEEWFPENDRTHYVWSSEMVAGTPVWTVLEVTVHNYPDDAAGEGSYITNAVLYASADATNPEEAMELGDKTHINAEDIPGEALATLEAMLLGDANLDTEYETLDPEDDG